MKALIVLTAAVVALAGCGGDAARIYGKWQKTAPGAAEVIEFTEDTMTVAGYTAKVHNYESLGDKVTVFIKEHPTIGLRFTFKGHAEICGEIGCFKKI